jgi:hypothetical protein
MAVPPKDRIELVLMSDQAASLHFWIQSNSDLARRVELNKEKSIRALGGAALLLVILLYFSPGATVILSLMGLIVLFPMTLVGMAGYFRGA